MEASFTPNIQLSEFALRIREYRQKNRLRYDELASLSGVSEERLFALELDRVTPTLAERRRLNKILK